MKRSRQKTLGRFTIDTQLREELDRSGLLDLRFGRGPALHGGQLMSLDGNRGLLYLCPSGNIGGLLVQDYVADEERTIPFEIGEIEIATRGDEFEVRFQPRAPDEHLHRTRMRAAEATRSRRTAQDR